MALHLMPGEAVLWSTVIRQDIRGWRDDEDAYITLTTRRLAKTYSGWAGGQSGALYLPLEKIDSVDQTSRRKDFTKGWVLALILGLLFCVLPGLVVLVIWFLSRDDSLVVTAGGGEMIIETGRLGGGDYQLELIDMLEGARQAVLRQPPPSAPARVTLTP